MRYFAGIDIGTTHTKLVLVDASLQPLYQFKLGYLNGQAEWLDADEILSHGLQLLALAAEQLPQDATALAIGFSSAMHSLVLVDRNGAAFGPLQTWADNSSAPALEFLQKNETAPALFRETGTPLHPMSPFCKLAWKKIFQPEALAAADKAVGIKEYIWHRLTGHWEIDHSIASATGLFSLRQRKWITAALELAGVRADQLSRPVPVTHNRILRQELIPGFEQRAIAVELVIGGSDGCLAQVGSGIISPGSAALTIGTSGAIRCTLQHPWIDEKKELFTYILDESLFVTGGAINNGGMALQWLQASVMGGSYEPGAVLQSFDQAAAEIAPGAEGLVCLPWFQGERAPVWNADASGIYAGIRSHHHQAHFKRALLEGICFSFRQLLEKLEAAAGPVGQVVVSGGFTASPAWLQMMADILRRPLRLPAEGLDASALGAIALAMKAAGEPGPAQKNTGDPRPWHAFLQKLPAAAAVYTPDTQFTATYSANYSRFLQLCRFSSSF